ncbi:hypothetical protein KXV85_002839, partial [Aspergillus fumigatus]
GAVLTRQLGEQGGGTQVICWALVICTPLAAVLAAFTWPESMASVGAPSWVGLFYVSVCTMLLGFIFWYRGLALGGIARVGQLQLLQPFMGLGLAALFLHEVIAPAMLLAVGAVEFFPMKPVAQPLGTLIIATAIGGMLVASSAAMAST